MDRSVDGTRHHRFFLRRAATLSGALVMAGACIAAGATTASAANLSSKTPGGQPANSSGWTFYPAGPSLVNATTTTVTGVRNAQGGCDFTRAGLSTSKDAAHIEIEVAFNASTCQVQYQSGLAPAAPLAASQTGGYMTANQTGASPAPASVVPTTAGFGNSAYQDNQYLDPFGIQTAAQEQWVNWNISGCVTNWSWNVKWSWLNDGWNLNQHAASGSSNCGGIFTNAYAQMSNGIFCNFIQTDYNRFGIQNGNVIQDHLNGFNNGTYGWSYNDEKAGPCAFLLHHGHTDHR